MTDADLAGPALAALRLPPPERSRGGGGRTRRWSEGHVPYHGGVRSSNLSVDEAVLLRQVGYEPAGLVSGSAVFYVAMALRRWKQNAEVPDLTRALVGARHEALSRLTEATKQRRGRGVAAVRLNLHTFEPGHEHHRVTFTTIGTALRSDRNPKGSGLVFTSALSGQDLYLLESAGYRALGLVMGSCVYHVAHRDFAQWATSQTTNVEMRSYTDAFYDARELAMLRMQDEARQLHATGIVGVTVTHRTHIWGSRIIEFFAIGTAVRAPATSERPIPPELGLALNGPSSRRTTTSLGMDRRPGTHT